MLRPPFNVHNREKSQVVVDQFANSMLRDAWEDNGAPIIIAVGNKLMDGQHRLRAVIQSGIARDFVVVRGVNPDTFGTIDIGSRRGLKDVLSILKEKNAPTLAAAISTHSAYTKGRTFRPKLRRHSPTPTEQARYLEKNPSLRKSVAFVVAFGSVIGHLKISKGSMAALHALFAAKDRPFANDFITKLITGEEITRRNPDQPVRRVRAKLLDDATQRAGSLSQQEKCVVVSLGWNAARNDALMKRFQVNAYGKNVVREIEIQ
jgi:hypothetical protein